MTDEELLQKVCDAFEDKPVVDLLKFIVILLASAVFICPDDEQERVIADFNVNLRAFLKHAKTDPRNNKKD